MTPPIIEKPTIIVNSHRCPQNHPCPMVRKCPQGAISQNGYEAPTIDRSRCTACGVCVKGCPYTAFVVHRD